MRAFLLICFCLSAAVMAGCAASRPAAPLKSTAATSDPTPAHETAAAKPTAPAASATPATQASKVQLVSHDEEQPPAELLPATRPKPVVSDLFPTTLPIDLPTALRLADADNLQVALAREQVQQAYAEYNAAGALWLPSIRGGIHRNRHEGTLLSSGGIVRDLSRNSLYAGAGAQAVGGGSPAVPGIFASFNLADAFFQPLAAQQRWGARENGATVTRNNTLLDVSLAYLELLRTAQDLAIAEDMRDKVREISRRTDAYAKTGQGLQSDADRLRVELGLREIDIRRSQEAQVVASARLTQLLHLEPCLRLEPADSGVIRLCFVPIDCGCAGLVAQALSNRPELMQNRYLVGEAVQRLRRERFAPLVPSILLGASYGGFGGGLGSTVGDYKDRFDLDASAFWEVRNLGYGESAARNGAGSRLRQAQIQELASLDQVAREVTEAFAQVQLRQQQIEQAREVVQFAVESFDRNLVRIVNGQGLPIEVLQSAQALLTSRREYLRSVTDYNAAQFNLQRALGWPVGGPELMDEPIIHEG